MNWNKFLGVLSLIVGLLATLAAFTQYLPAELAAPLIIGAALGKALTRSLTKATDHQAWTICGCVGTALFGTLDVISGISIKYGVLALIASQILISFGRDLKSLVNPQNTTPLLIVALLLVNCALTGCDPKKVEREFALSTKRTADYCGEALKAIGALLDNGQLAADSAERFTNIVMAVNDVDKRLIAEAQKYVVIENGKRVLHLTEEGRVNLTKLADSLRELTLQLLNDPDFQRLTGSAKTQLAFIAAEMLPVVASIFSLIHAIKPLPQPGPIASAWFASPLQVVALPQPTPQATPALRQ